MRRKKKLYLELQRKIKNYSQIVNIPPIHGNQPHTWCPLITATKSENSDYGQQIIYPSGVNMKRDNLLVEPIKTVRYELDLTDKQKQIMHSWFDATYRLMYNLIIKKIKDTFRLQLKTNDKLKLHEMEIDLSINKLKKEFADDKKRLHKKTLINMHILDYAMTDACAMFKSKMSNVINGHQKKTRLRYLKKTKNNKIFKVEKCLCSENSFCPNVLGKIIKTTRGINFKEATEMVGIV